MQNSDPIVIVSFARTPIGALQGVFATISSAQLGSNAIRATLQRAQVQPSAIQQVYMGCVLPAAVGQAPARQAALNADLPDSTVCATISKVCGSGMQAIMFAHDNLLVNEDAAQMIIAGGMESMTNAPYLLTKARSGYRMGNAQMYDHMLLDGLEDAYSHKSMGLLADETAAELNISRSEQDEFAARSLQLAQKSIKDNLFNNEIVPVVVQLKTGPETISIDEIPGKNKAEKIPQLKPAFNPNGTVTAANSSSIADGAAALLLMRMSTAQKNGLKPIAKILATSAVAKDPAHYTTAPVQAIKKVLTKASLTLSQIDLFEINEAFAVVTLAAIKELNLDINKVNVHGGACALGHPIGASGARIVCTLLGAMQNANKKLGVASLCIGGGEATALAIELL